MPIKIHYPTARALVKPIFVASGLVNSKSNGMPVIGVIGKLTSRIDNMTVTIEGETVLFRIRRHKVVGKHCWVILFKVPAVHAGNYTLEVTSILADGSTAQADKVLHINVGAVRLLEVEHPSSNDVITPEEKDYLVASGPISPVAVFATRATLTNGALVVIADYIDTSPEDHIWWATFPPLTKGTYDLVVEGTGNNVGTAVNVEVP